MGSPDIAGPKIAMIAPNSPSAAPAPRSADFQPRVIPAAKTIVVASTASTAQARNTAKKSAKPVITPV